jgi:hypothetical protein
MTIRLAVLLVTLLWAAGPPRDVSGVWTIAVGSQSASVTCNFKQDGEDLSGECKGAGGAVLQVVGAVTDDTVTWQIDDDLLFSGTLDEKGEVITGTFLFDGGNGSDSFTARKQ